MTTVHTHGPSYDGAVMIDVGPGVGALVIHAPATLLGTEIEVTPLGGDHRHTHVEIRERRLPNGTFYAAVFPSLAAGSYLVDGRVVAVPEASVAELNL
jgi:hypothetical protein